MKVNLELLEKAISKARYGINDYSGETLKETEITIQEENLENGKLGELIVIKLYIDKVDKYGDKAESKLIKIIEIPGCTDGIGNKYNITTQHVETFDIDPKKSSL